MTGEDTKQRILDAAERLFGMDGFAGTSLRAITKDAGVNLAAVHYHFGSKEALLRATLHRILGPMNARRLSMLKEAEAAAAPDPAPIGAVLRAFLEPDLHVIRDLGDRGVLVTRFTARSYTEPSELVREVLDAEFGPLREPFGRAFVRAVPHVPAQEVLWRLRVGVVGVISFLLGGGDPVYATEGPLDVEEMLERLIAFLAPAMEAPASGGGGGDAVRTEK